MFSISYAFKGQVHVFAGRVNIVSHSSCRTSAILKYFCPLLPMTASSVSIVEARICKKGEIFNKNRTSYVIFYIFSSLLCYMQGTKIPLVRS